VFHLACILQSDLNNIWKQFTYLHEVWCQCHATTGDYMLCPEKKWHFFVTLFNQECKFYFSIYHKNEAELQSEHN